ncbi:MAG: gliding motility-associated ABC transporter ATP-binding subunit GldA [Bacteroidales bacterium]|nr:gliding motility-associated ABC transporter ATP-binding subunit GldA [Bacteroidales bacterium]
MSIKVENVVKKYGRQTALNHVSFEVFKGEIAGFIGPNGAGKSTMMRIICGLLAPFSGDVLINDISVSGNSLEVRKNLGYLPEHNPLYPEMYIREYLEYAAGLYKNQDIKSNRINEIIELTGLAPEINKKIGQLSKGYRQRVGLAQALLHNPQILILDEPTTGLDPNQIIEIRSLIKELGREKTILLSTHIMQEVEAICDRVIIINKGEIVADGHPSELKSRHTGSFQSLVVEFNKHVGAEIFEPVDGIDLVKQVDEHTWIIQYEYEKDIRPEIFNLAVKNNIAVLALQKVDKRLEDVFRELTAR